MCALSATRCSSSDETGPASSCVLHCLRPGTAVRHPCHWEPGLFGFPCQRMLALVLLLPAPGWMDQPSLPCTSWVSVAEHWPWLCPIPAAAPSPGCSLTLAVPCHVLAQALWPGLLVEEPFFLLVVLPSPPGWGRTTSGLCPYLSQHCAISDCIFGIKSELLLHPLGSRLAQLRFC